MFTRPSGSPAMFDASRRASSKCSTHDAIRKPAGQQASPIMAPETGYAIRTRAAPSAPARRADRPCGRRGIEDSRTATLNALATGRWGGVLSRARGAVPAHHGMSGSGAEQLVRARRALRATESRRAIGPAARFAPAACCVRGHCGTREGRPYSSDRLSEVSANLHDASAAIPRIALRRPTALPDTDGDWDAGDQLIIAREGRIDETTKAVGHRSITSGQPGSEGPSTASSDSLFLCARCPAAGGPIAGASDRLRDRLGQPCRTGLGWRWGACQIPSRQRELSVAGDDPSRQRDLSVHTHAGGQFSQLPWTSACAGVTKRDASRARRTPQ